MMHPIVLPKLGLTTSEAIIRRWLKSIGERVTMGEALVEIETDKAVVEIPSDKDGYLARPLALGTVVQVGEPMAFLTDGQDGDELSTPKAVQPSEMRSILASPYVRKLAREHAIDLTTITPSRRSGRIVAQDVLPLIVQPMERSDPEPLVTRNVRISKRWPLAGRRRLIAQRLQQSWRTAVPVTITRRVDVTDTLRMIDDIRTQLGIHVTITDVVVTSVAAALDEHPVMAASLEGEEVTIYEEPGVGLAIDTEEGLVVGVIPFAATRRLLALARYREALVRKARTQGLGALEVAGSRITVSNLGGFGVETFTPILSPGETAILGVGQWHVQSHDGNNVPLLPLSLTFDHRVVDGAPAARFLRSVSRNLQEPWRCLNYALDDVSTEKGERDA